MPAPHPVQPWHDARMLDIRGPGAAEFLQGYLTCDTRRLSADRVIPMAICTVKGRTLASGWAVRCTDSIGLIIHTSLLERITAFLKPYVTFSKCTMSSDDKPVWVTLQNSSADTQETAESGQLIPGANLVSPLDKDLSVQGDAEDASTAMAQQLVAHHFVFLQEAVCEQFLPQMLNLDDVGAVDFDKGCYLGQEIVARAQFRGAVKRKTSAFTWQDKPPAVGEIWQQGTVVGIDSSGSGLVCSKVSG